ncbi:MAG TPA: 1-(5-phosphoribosyl)-5-[(5-phosphoribosylamino)methylideneamino]imidazole-4-carboxamide isomerase [Methanolinea sp.]|nr:1-(5-phosphoribosyl)-5-[(5-phosphoribosylamino)methylideneamino]imidazole-4-carboxamide isomerase [Methanolinea sp.]HQK55517.1 1-(5-phosphoribosyl)-5-[(5-phosphoribosylamino)methylideneamino]imidazole-4-carboxamide isomerase [Methanolinea sp.]
MRVFPAVDILKGECVQLVQGKKDSATVFGDPLDCARRWLDLGARCLHVVNLDGAFGDSSSNAQKIRQIVQETDIEVQLGGGIRSYEDASAWLETGVERIILGTLATRDPPVLKRLSDEFGSSRIMAGVDARGGEITIEGWQKSGGDYLVWAERFEDMGAGALLFTNVDVEGLQSGIDPEPVARLLRHTRLPVTVAGGITTIDDIRVLKHLGSSGVVLGSALYSGRLQLRDAMEAAE